MSNNRFVSATRQRIAETDRKFRAELLREFSAIGDRQMKRYQGVVDNWTHKPDFVTVVRITRNGVELRIDATGPNAKYWVWVDKGTKPHIIQARNGGQPTSHTAYQPKTVPGGYGGISGYTGGWVSTDVVNHPGTEARNFGADFERQFRQERRRAITNAFRRAQRR